MKNQSFGGIGTEIIDVAYFRDALPVDGFDLSIKQVPDDKEGKHAKVELVFKQNKGSRKIDVVAAVKMQAWELEQLAELIKAKLEAFKGKGE